MPERLTDIGAITELVTDYNWIITIDDELVRVHLAEIICRLLEVPHGDSVSFVERVRRQQGAFRTDEEDKEA